MEINTDDLYYIKEYSSIVGKVPKSVYIDQEYLFFITDTPDLDLKYVHTLSKKFNSKIVILGYSNKLDEFIRLFYNNVKINRYDVFDANQDKVLVIFVDPKYVKYAIGNNSSKLRAAKKIFKELFNINDVVIKKDITMEG